ELAHEEAFLKSPPSGLKVPALFTAGGNGEAGWLVMEKIPGELLNDVLASERHIDREKVISDLLDQLVILEEHG
ncbi:kinase, partial [Klebsiella pneumoniae]|nr:kinase [Klebsiella pneumoniae]